MIRTAILGASASMMDRMGEVSSQVYRDLCVITARPTAADEARAPHALYGYVDAADSCAAARWAAANSRLRPASLFPVRTTMSRSSTCC